MLKKGDVIIFRNYNYMKKTYNNIEQLFEKLTSVITLLLGNPITFIMAFILVLSWWSINLFTKQNLHQIIGDIIFGTTFLSLFIIQKSFNRFSASLHLKINELVSSHETASNSVINAEIKTEREITVLAKEYTELAEQIHIIEEKKAEDNQDTNMTSKES
jgi:low affinity Fe/Cu permease